VTTVQLERDEDEKLIAAGLQEHGLSARQITAGLKYYRKMLSRFDKYKQAPTKAIMPIVNNIRNMERGYIGKSIDDEMRAL